MDEIEALQEQLITGAEQRSIRIVAADFAEPSVVLIHEATSVDEVLDIVQQSFTPFISITTSYIDRDEVEAKFRGNDEGAELPTEVVRILDEHADDLARLDVFWVAAGVIFQYAATPEWWRELSAALDDREEDRRTQHADEMRAYRIRVTSLSEQLELMPEYRAATNANRGTVGKALFDDRLRGPEDGVAMEKHVLEAASKRVRANAETQYAQVDITDQALIQQLQQTESWRNANGAQERDAATRAFLENLTGGYSPKQDMVVSLRRRAALPPQRPYRR